MGRDMVWGGNRVGTGYGVGLDRMGQGGMGGKGWDGMGWDGMGCDGGYDEPYDVSEGRTNWGELHEQSQRAQPHRHAVDGEERKERIDTAAAHNS